MSHDAFWALINVGVAVFFILAQIAALLWVRWYFRRPL
jgi:hypothetical protein